MVLKKYGFLNMEPNRSMVLSPDSTDGRVFALKNLDCSSCQSIGHGYWSSNQWDAMKSRLDPMVVQLDVLDLTQVKFKKGGPDYDDTLAAIESFIFGLSVKLKIECKFSLFVWLEKAQRFLLKIQFVK